ncbi:MAG: DUF5011 domain-containing protein [Fibrobacter sp.]|nr:DUF5011 domain-containing protein [Fibrobacter sp.]
MVKNIFQCFITFTTAFFLLCSFQNTTDYFPGTKEIIPVVILKTAQNNSERVDDVESMRFSIYSPSGEFKDTIRATFPFKSHKGTLRIPDGYSFTMVVEGLDKDSNVAFYGKIEVTDTKTDPLELTIEAHEVTPINPSTLQITALSPCTYKLQWTDNSTNENGFIIDVRNKSGIFDSIATVPADTCTFLYNGTTDKKYMIFRIRAFSDAGYSSPLIDSIAVPSGNTGKKAPVFLIDSSDVSGIVYLGTTKSFQIKAFDPNCDSYTFTACSALTIITPATVSWSPAPKDLGIHRFFVIAADYSGAADTLYWTWEVRDTTGPEITLIGRDTLRLSLNDIFIDPGATAMDNVDGDVSSEIIVSGTVKTSESGTYTVKYSVTDKFNNLSIRTRTVIVYAGEIPDQVPPVLILKGDDTITITVGEKFTDPGAIAIDNHDDTITSKITVQSNVNTSKPGIYTIKYSVSDSNKNKAHEKIRYVKVVDITVPELTLTGPETLLVEINENFEEPGVTATDNYDGNLTDSVMVDGSVDTSEPGIYKLRYTVSDPHGNADTIFRTVIVADRTPPTITLNGSDRLVLHMGDTYLEPGAKAFDQHDGDISDRITISGVVISSKPGFYTRFYDVKDSAGNAATQAFRIIQVMDSIPPVITLKGKDTIRVALNTSFTDPGATALDNYNGDLTDKITILGKVDTSKVASYTLTYSVADSSGNEAKKSRVVSVFDSISPVITLIGNQKMRLPVFTAYKEPGVKITDNYDKNLTDSLKIKGTVDTAKIGNDTLFYSVTDRSGNTGTNYRIITVFDSIAPQIKLKGKDTIRINVDDTFTEPGYTATDNYDGDLSDSVTVTGEVQTALPDTTILEYNVKDSSGNAARKRIRVVIVK